MPIEADIPLEIDNYQKKLVFGLTPRQLVCLIATGLVAAGVFALFVLVLGLDTHDAGWFIMAAVIPTLALGFVRPDGAPFEQFLARKLRHHLRTNRLCYTAEPGPAPSECQKTKRKGGIRHAAHPMENTYRSRPEASRKRRRRETARHIKAAKKEYRQASAKARQARRRAARA